MRNILILILFITAGCSNKAIYDNAQINNKNDCLSVPHSQLDECMERANKSFEEYQMRRKEILDK